MLGVHPHNWYFSFLAIFDFIYLNGRREITAKTALTLLVSTVCLKQVYQSSSMSAILIAPTTL